MRGKEETIKTTRVGTKPAKRLYHTNSSPQSLTTFLGFKKWEGEGEQDHYRCFKIIFQTSSTNTIKKENIDTLFISNFH